MFHEWMHMGLQVLFPKPRNFSHLARKKFFLSFSLSFFLPLFLLSFFLSLSLSLSLSRCYLCSSIVVLTLPGICNLNSHGPDTCRGARIWTRTLNMIKRAGFPESVISIMARSPPGITQDRTQRIHTESQDRYYNF